MPEYLRPQSPIYSKENDAFIYPMTTVDQVIMPDGSRLNSKVISVNMDNAEVGEPTPLNADTLGGQKPSYYAKATQVTPRNLLDNSDFTNPVNQRGVTTTTGKVYGIDRWVGNGDNTVMTITDGGITVTGSYLAQGLEFPYTEKTLTIAAKSKNGDIAIASCTVPVATIYQWLCTNGGSNGKIWVGIMQTDKGMLRVNIYCNNGDTVEWAALYEGEHTIDTLPEYQPKGYAVELAECRRYFRRKNGTLLPGFINGNIKQIVVNVENDEPFYKFPTFEINAISWIRGSGKNITTIPTWTISAFNNSPINPVFIINFAETIADTVYANVYVYCSYTLSADL